jgi:hypothetical protein
MFDQTKAVIKTGDPTPDSYNDGDDTLYGSFVKVLDDHAGDLDSTTHKRFKKVCFNNKVFEN